MTQNQISHTIHVLVADSTRMYTELLADALGRDDHIKVMSAAADPKSILEYIQQHKNLDVVVLGCNLDEIPLHGIALLREIRTLRPDIKGVVLLDSSRKEIILEAFRAGAKGLFSRHEPLEILSKCVRQVYAGQVWANSEQMSYAVEALALAPNIKAVDANGVGLLSKRELEVVRSLAEGLTNREIAARLGLSQHTIKNYLFRIFDKLGVSSRMELLFLAFNQNAAGSLFPELATKASSNDLSVGPSVVWYRKAAEEGVALAQVGLAEMYLHGKGMPKNASAAYMWYVVSEQTSQALNQEIVLIKKKLEAQLTPDEVLEARHKASDMVRQIQQSQSTHRAAHV
jgi:two-component system, NarL family, nitrate/nitrite response regulator NarL